MLPGEREFWFRKRFLSRHLSKLTELSERQAANEISALAGSDQFAATRTAALLYAFVAK